MKKPQVLVIVPPWPKTGSANLFAASVGALVQRGFDVFVLVAALRQTDGEQGAVCRRMANILSKSATIGCGHTRQRENQHSNPECTSLETRARFVANGILPPALHKLIASRPFTAIHVHHCWNLRLARRIARKVATAHGLTPQVYCETHDVQSQNMDRVNPESIEAATEQEIEATEVQLCRLADYLIHINESDFDFFQRRMPGAYHSLLPPTIAPESESALRAMRDWSGPAPGKLVYLAAPNYWNYETVCWLLEKVLPLVNGLRENLTIYGGIRHMLKRKRPGLFARYSDLLVGQVASISDAYKDAKAVLVPALGGSGSSIKLLEAMCLGRPMLATSAITRGLRQESLAELPITIVDDTRGFAGAVQELLLAPFAGKQQPLIDAYEAEYSCDVYNSRLNQICETILMQSMTHRTAS